MGGERSAQSSRQCSAGAQVIIEMGHVTFHQSGFPCSATKAAKETAGTWHVPVPREGLWLLRRLMEKEGVTHSACRLEDRTDLTRKESCSLLTPTARPHLLGCCITTPLRPETYLAGFFQGHVDAPQEAQKPWPSAFTQWFAFLT